MSLPSSICVYCGSSADVAQSYKDAAVHLGREAGAAGGRVTGIIPSHILEMEVAHQTLTELIVVENMHQRKMMMFDRSDAFVILPGGLGTLDEAFEILTWKQLGLHRKPIIVAN